MSLNIKKMREKVGSPASSQGGRPRKPVTNEDIAAAKSAGFSWTQIARYFEISTATAKRRVSEHHRQNH